MLRVLSVLLCGFLWSSFASVAQEITEKRVALVVGNGSYGVLRPLANPKNDANAVAAKLETAGFEIIKALDADWRSMRGKLKEFRRKSKSADVKLIFYAGHGIQSEGVNYIIPVDADIQIDDDISRFSFDLQRLIADMTVSGGLNIILLDACRDDPIPSNQATRSATPVKVKRVYRRWWKSG